MTKREAFDAQSQGIRALKRAALEPPAEDAEQLLSEFWRKRSSASSMLFRARRLPLSDLIQQLLSRFLQGAVPSPFIQNNLKEALFAGWIQDPQLVDDTIRQICESADPSAPLKFQAAVDVCHVFLQNAWCRRETFDEHDPKQPSGSVLLSLNLFMTGISHWISKTKIKSGEGGEQQEQQTDATVDYMTERTMEHCAFAFQQIFASDTFFEHLPNLVAANRAAWEALSDTLHTAFSMASGLQKLQGLWLELRTLSDPVQLSIHSEPHLIKELLGTDMQSDDVTRRTLMLAMWSTMDRSNHDAVDVNSLALLMHDVRLLQGSRNTHFTYNMWLSSLFILHNSKQNTPERKVGRHFLLIQLPQLMQRMVRVEADTALASRSPCTSLKIHDDSQGEGTIEHAFARVRQWPQFLHINSPNSAPPDVWELVCEAFVDAGAMTEKHVQFHIKPLATWTRTQAVPTGKEGMAQGKPPKTIEDIAVLEEMLRFSFKDPNSVKKAPQAWVLLVEEVTRGSSLSTAAAKTIEGVMGVPAHLHNPDPVPAGVYVQLATSLIVNPAATDMIKAQGALMPLILGIVYRVDVFGSKNPAENAPEVHRHFGELFLVVAFLVNRYKLHLSPVFLTSLEKHSLRWSKVEQRGCFVCWLRRHAEVQRFGKLNMEDRSVENKLVDSVFNLNWGKSTELEKTVRNYSPWAIVECVPSFTERVFQGCCADRMQPAAAAQALLMLVTVVRYGMVDAVSHLAMQATNYRFEGGGKAEQVCAGLAVEVLQKLLEGLSPDESRPLQQQLVFIDRNLGFLLSKLGEDEGGAALKAKISKAVDLAPVDFQSHKKVIYDVLVGVHRGGPQLQHSEIMRLLRRRIPPYDLAHSMISEVMMLASQGTSSPSFATMFNLASIGSFLLSHGAPGLSERRNEIAEAYMQEVLPAMLLRLDNARQSLLLSRFTVMLSLSLGCGAWRSERAPHAFPPPPEHEGTPSHAAVALRAAFGPVPEMLERLGRTAVNEEDKKTAAMFIYALSMLTQAIRVRWLMRYMDVPRAVKVLRGLRQYRLAWLAHDCLTTPQDSFVPPPNILPSATDAPAPPPPV